MFCLYFFLLISNLDMIRWFTRCCLGYTRLRHSNLLKGEPPPLCLPYHTTITLKHFFLLDCTLFNINRQLFYSEICLYLKSITCIYFRYFFCLVITLNGLYSFLIIVWLLFIPFLPLLLTWCSLRHRYINTGQTRQWSAAGMTYFCRPMQ